MQRFFWAIIVGLGTITASITITAAPAHATTVKEMRLMCQDYRQNNYNVITKPHAYCAGYFQAQIQTTEALCKTLKILYTNKPEQREVIMGMSTLFASSAEAKEYREVISAFIDWAKGKPKFDAKNPSIFLNEYLPVTWPCDPSKPLDASAKASP